MHHIRCGIKYNIIVADNLQCNHFRDCQKVIIYICEQVNCKQIYLPVIFKINAKPKRNNLEFILTKLPYTSYHIRFENAMVQFTNAYVAITPLGIKLRCMLVNTLDGNVFRIRICNNLVYLVFF